MVLHDSCSRSPSRLTKLQNLQTPCLSCELATAQAQILHMKTGQEKLKEETSQQLSHLWLWLRCSSTRKLQMSLDKNWESSLNVYCLDLLDHLKNMLFIFDPSNWDFRRGRKFRSQLPVKRERGIETAERRSEKRRVRGKKILDTSATALCGCAGLNICNPLLRG